jgi:hypothetical protein
MVHGIDLGVRYIIKLNKKIDYYDIFLNICISLRKMISIIDNNKIIILNNNLLEERFKELPLVEEYCKNIGISKYNPDSDGSDLKWIDVYKYSSQIKFSKDDIIKKEEEITEYEEKIEKLKKEDIYFRDLKEYQDLKKLINLNEIVYHQNYYDTIINLEKQITNITLNEEEIELINKIKNIPLLNGLIQDEGFELICEEY